MRYVCIALLLMASPAWADPMQEIEDAIYEQVSGKIYIKKQYRSCTADRDCTSVLSMCRWRATNKASRKYVADVSAKWVPQCKWPPVAPQPKVVSCVAGVCEIPSDGKNF